MQILEEKEQSLDDLIVKARTDAELKKIIAGKPVTEPKKTVESGLIYSWREHIYAVTEHRKDAYIPVASVEGHIQSMTFFNNGLLYSTGGDLMKYDFGKIWGRDVYCMCAGKMFLYTVHEINSTGNHIITHFDRNYQMVPPSNRAEGCVMAMCEFNNHFLYASGGTLYSIDGTDHFGFSETIYSICEFDSVAWIALGNKVCTAAENYNHTRPSPVLSICSYDGKLYDAGKYGIFETLEDKKIIDNPADDLTIVPLNVFEK
jgi:hypothetical protein